MKISVNDAKPGDVIYADDGREVGFIALVAADEIGIEFDREFGIDKMIRLSRAKMDCSRSTLLLPMHWAQKALSTRLLHLAAD
jgi:hypothetical protein